MSNMEIISFSDALAPHFARLNKAWLEKYFNVEPVDQLMLDNPKEFFLDKGGFIYFARINQDIAGTFALLKESETVFELSKMAVDDKYQGMNVGNTMMQFCIAKAKSLALNKIILYSNTRLGPAIHLYKKYGFTEVSINHSVYKRSNIKMELVIN